MSVKWTRVREMNQGFDDYKRKVLFAVKQVAQYWSATFEAYAKERAPWTDQTGNARQTLHSWIEELSRDTVRIYLSHGVHYGIFLETKYAGRYSIIWPTIERHLEQIRRMLQEIFG